ncbi:hypothetical protein FACS1894161_2520 [Spirochaetia bacterium]|nr:hypothetical protein FACS1894161_2520 [Spirochaetia bacterium]
MASKYAVETVFKLIDKITAPLDQVGNKGKALGKALKKDFLATQNAVAGLGDKLKTFGKYAAMAGVGALGVGIAVVTNQFIEFDQAATGATAKFKDLDVTSATYAKSLEKIKQKAREVAAVTEYNAVDTAGALEKMAMAGLTSEQSMAMLMGTTNLATAAGMDLTTAVDIATDSLGAFGLITDDAGQLAVNMDRVSDVMAKTTNMFNTDMAGMFESVKKGAPTFTAAGQSLEDFSALTGVLASSGIKGSEAGTQLRNMMISLANPSNKAAGSLKRLGITTKDANGNFLNIIDIIGQFEQGTKDLGTAEKAAAMATIFGTRTVTGMNILMGEGAESLRRYRTELENAGGAAAEIADAMRGSIKNRIELLKSAATDLGFKFVGAFQTKGVSSIEKLTEAISKFDPQPIVDGLTTVADIIGGLIKIVWSLRYFIMGAAIAWGIYQAAMIAAVVISNIMGMVRAVQTLMMMQKGMNVVQAIFNVLLMASPTKLIIVAVGILIGLVILMVKHWDDICAVLGRAWEWIKNVAAIIWDGLVSAFTAAADWIGNVATIIWDGLVNAFQAVAQWIQTNSEKVMALITIFTGPFGFIISIIKELKDNWEAVVEAFKSDGIIGALKMIGGIILSAVLAPIQGLLEMLAKIPGVGKLLGPAVEKLQSFRNELKGIDDTSAVVQAVVPDAVNSAAAGTRTATSGVSPVSPGIGAAAVQPTAPMTVAQQQAYYSRSESVETVNVNVRPEPGTAASVQRRETKPSNVRMPYSGSN